MSAQHSRTRMHFTETCIVLLDVLWNYARVCEAHRVQRGNFQLDYIFVCSERVATVSRFAFVSCYLQARNTNCHWIIRSSCTLHVYTIKFHSSMQTPYFSYRLACRSLDDVGHISIFCMANGPRVESRAGYMHSPFSRRAARYAAIY